MKKTGAVFLCLVLVGCGDGSTYEERMEKFNAAIGQMECPTLKTEMVYQNQIKAGITDRQYDDVTTGDGFATVLTLGYNIAENSIHKSGLGERLQETNEKIHQVKLIQQRKGCIE